MGFLLPKIIRINETNNEIIIVEKILKEAYCNESSKLTHQDKTWQ